MPTQSKWEKTEAIWGEGGEISIIFSENEDTALIKQLQDVTFKKINDRKSSWN